MKNITLILSAAVMLFIVSCKKENQEKVNAALTGKWSVYAIYTSNGAVGKWTYPQFVTAQYVAFNANGTLGGNEFSQFSNYKLKDSVTISLLKSDSTIQNYKYKINKDTLTMSPAGPVFCIEGCATKFIKQQ